MFASIFVSSILLLPYVNGGCSFSQEGKDTSGVFKDMDAARCPHLSYRSSVLQHDTVLHRGRKDAIDIISMSGLQPKWLWHTKALT